ncbi:MAG: DUF4845 domain-containing protein [Proteobacteria bacterium]|nr:DUF4845 domain-containing protein [Pseudomonadota bacterium]
MKNMRNKQHGIGFMGWSCILGAFAFFVLIGLRIFPLYNEKLIVINAMESVVNRPDAAKLSKSDVRKYYRINFELSSNTGRFSKAKDLKKLVNVVTDKKTKKKYIHVAYEGKNVFIKDIHFLLVFDQKMELGGSGGE